MDNRWHILVSKSNKHICQDSRVIASAGVSKRPLMIKIALQQSFNEFQLEGLSEFPALHFDYYAWLFFSEDYQMHLDWSCIVGTIALSA